MPCGCCSGRSTRPRWQASSPGTTTSAPCRSPPVDRQAERVAGEVGCDLRRRGGIDLRVRERDLDCETVEQRGERRGEPLLVDLPDLLGPPTVLHDVGDERAPAAVE